MLPLEPIPQFFYIGKSSFTFLGACFNSIKHDEHISIKISISHVFSQVLVPRSININTLTSHRTI